MTLKHRQKSAFRLCFVEFFFRFRLGEMKAMLKSVDLMLVNIAKRFVQTSAANLKGHSKWQNIKHVKSENDQQRSQMITKQMRLLRLAANGLFNEFFFQCILMQL